MRLPLGLALVATLLLGSSVTAQGNSAVIPPYLANEEGNSLNPEPFGYSRSHHTQFIDASWLTAVPQGAMLNALSYRMDTQFATTTYWHNSTSTWYLRLANTSTSAYIPTPVWPSRPDQGPPDPHWTLAITARSILFPDIPKGEVQPAPFSIRLPFDQPFMFLGPNLGIDHFTYDALLNIKRTYYADAEQQTAVGGTVTPVGGSSPGCPSGLNRAAGVAPDPGGDLEMLLFGPVQVPAWAMLGVTPLRLSLAPNGLPGCFLYTQPLVFIPSSTDSIGLARLTAPVPRTAAAAGQVLYGQWLVTDPSVNPAVGLTSSDGLQFTIGNDLSAQQVAMSVVLNTANPIAGFGFPVSGRGLVVKLEW